VKRAEALAAHAAKLKGTIKALADRDYPAPVSERAGLRRAVRAGRNRCSARRWRATTI